MRVVFLLFMLFSQLLAKDLLDSLAWWQSQGYVFADTVRDAQGNLQMERGTAWVWGNLKRQGKSQTNPLILEKMSGIEAGTLVDLRQLAQGKIRLESYPWIAQVQSLNIYRKSNRQVIIPVVRVQENPRNHVEGWLLWSGQWMGNAQLEFSNLRGSGRSVQFGFSAQDSLRDFQANYLEPFVLGQDWSLALSGQWRQAGKQEQWMQGQGTLTWWTGLWRWGSGFQWSGLETAQKWQEQSLLLMHAQRRTSWWKTQMQVGMGKREKWVGEHAGQLELQIPWRMTHVQLLAQTQGLWPKSLERSPLELIPLGVDQFGGYIPREKLAVQVQSIRAGWGVGEVLQFHLQGELGAWQGPSDSLWIPEFHYGAQIRLQKNTQQLGLGVHWRAGRRWGQGILALALQEEW